MRHRRTATLAAVVTAAAAVTTLSSGTAHAARATVVDPLFDSGPATDIRSALYANGGDRVAVVGRVPGLRRSGTAFLHITEYETFESGWVVRMRKAPGKAPTTRLLYFDHFDLEPRPCPGVSGTWGRQAVHLSVPRSCLRGSASGAVFTQFAMERGAEEDLAPEVVSLRRH